MSKIQKSSLGMIIPMMGYLNEYNIYDDNYLEEHKDKENCIPFSIYFLIKSLLEYFKVV